MLLVDTNVWMERLLDQERSAEVGQFLDAVPADALFITDFVITYPESFADNVA
jgi:predicted nucleic-acid-binding protein